MLRGMLVGFYVYFNQKLTCQVKLQAESSRYTRSQAIGSLAGFPTLTDIQGESPWLHKRPCQSKEAMLRSRLHRHPRGKEDLQSADEKNTTPRIKH